MYPTLKARVIVITGASSGIGRETALQFAREGALVVAAARRRDRLEALRAEIAAQGGRCEIVVTDVGERAQVQHLLDVTLEYFGQVDIWVNNAGFGFSGSLEQTDPAEMDRLWRVNYMGAFHGCQTALAQMRRQGRGLIINVSSMAARTPLPLHAAYTATKCAITGLSQALDLELAGSGIRVSVILPGLTDTEFGAASIKKIPDLPGRKSAVVVPVTVVARKIVQCARRPRATLYIVPLGRFTVALLELFPAVWRRIARHYIHLRTGGRGIPTPE